MKKRKFKTESEKLLHLMAHSIYTQKEIFLRELISNSSDALDKRHFLALTDESIREDNYQIVISLLKEERILKISDNGIGFTEEELINNLGMIAKSGSKEFLEGLEKNDTNIIGQFGVGFYSAFMVSEKVEVVTKSIKSEKAYKWASNGVETYTIQEAEKAEIGTDIFLYLKEDLKEEENKESFSIFLEDHEIKNLVKKYSNYISYPIYLNDNLEEPLNEMTPLWKRSKKDIKEADLKEFYKQKYYDSEDPLRSIHMSIEGLLEFDALLFIPKKAPYNFYSESFEKGLELYSKGVFIQANNKDLIGDHFKFVRGLVDSSDLSLNISRELLQQDRQLKRISTTIEKRIKSELLKMLNNERELYETFYEEYKTVLKYGVYTSFGLKKELLEDLLMFKTSKEDKYLTLKEYLDKKPEEQKEIYYATGNSRAAILNLPQMEIIKAKGYDVLLFTDEVDEFMIGILNNYQDIPFKSIQTADFDVLDEKEKAELETLSEEHKDLLESLKEILKEKVSDVRLSKRLKEAPVCIVSGEGVSLEMEKVLKQVPNAGNVKADKILEINGDHKLFKVLNNLKDDQDALKSYANLLYHQALLIEGIKLENPQEYLDDVFKLMTKEL
ncbi:MAG: molecular chaperone HtpG [Acholeplasmatales bacterium]|nr:molecular chaperone HtpG [Acholeplasmataceae bacterium]MCK9427361.1 molecular chaperone HtpG [Acholeplasmataceae bacterium]MDD4090300.1 molecular chaperone HtpG [Acholeplasmataceae bacterium]MDY0115743.1 molecular chaperone HtpG [Acholeplasmatales bacterium]